MTDKTQELIELTDAYGAALLDYHTAQKANPALREKSAAAHQAILDALEAQAREIERLQKLVDSRVPASDYVNASNAIVSLEAELAAIRAQEPVGFVGAGYLTLGEGRISENETDVYKVAVYASPVVDVNAGLVEDAARWQHLMTCHVHQIAPMFGITFGNYTPEKDTIERVNVTIDAARTQQAQKGGE